MTTRMPCWGVVAAIVAMMLLVSGAGLLLSGAGLSLSGAGAQTTNCTLAYSSVTTCLAYVQDNDTTPSPQCCSGISYLNTNRPECLCQIVNQFNSSTTSGVNATKAFALPSRCGVVVDSAKCPALALAPGAAVAPTPPSSVTPPPPGVGATESSSSIAAPPTDLFVAFTALLAATHLVWNAFTAT